MRARLQAEVLHGKDDEGFSERVKIVQAFKDTATEAKSIVQLLNTILMPGFLSGSTAPLHSIL